MHPLREIIHHCPYWISHIKTPIWKSYRLITQSDWKLRKIHLLPINVYQGLIHLDGCFLWKKNKWMYKMKNCWPLNKPFALSRCIQAKTSRLTLCTITAHLHNHALVLWIRICLPAVAAVGDIIYHEIKKRCSINSFKNILLGLETLNSPKWIHILFFFFGITIPDHSGHASPSQETAL